MWEETREVDQYLTLVSFFPFVQDHETPKRHPRPSSTFFGDARRLLFLSSSLDPRIAASSVTPHLGKMESGKPTKPSNTTKVLPEFSEEERKAMNDKLSRSFEMLILVTNGGVLAITVVSIIFACANWKFTIRHQWIHCSRRMKSFLNRVWVWVLYERREDADRTGREER